MFSIKNAQLTYIQWAGNCPNHSINSKGFCLQPPNEKISANFTYFCTQGILQLNPIRGFQLPTNLVVTSMDFSEDRIKNFEFNLAKGCYSIDCTPDINFNFELIISHADDKPATPLVNLADESLASQLRNLLKSQEDYDVSLEAEGKTIPCHRCIIATRSDVFKRMFKNEFKEVLDKKVMIKDIEFETLKLLIEFMYTDLIEFTGIQMALKTIIAADKYNVKLLVQIGGEYIAKNVTINDALEALIIANKLHTNVWKKACLDLLITLNQEDLLNQFKDFPDCFEASMEIMATLAKNKNG